MKRSAGILMFRFAGEGLLVLLVHPGGPFWAKKDAGAWSIPKGEFTDEDPLQAARREFEEEIGVAVTGEFVPLAPCRQKSGKVVHAWAVEGNVDVTRVRSNTFTTGSGRSYPEIDRAEWFSIGTAAGKINPAQVAFLEELQRKLGRHDQ
jgi:predicted NUDIX family NTP pyrophosphohydrolase